MISVSNETIWHTYPLPMMASDGGKKESMREEEWTQTSAKPGFTLVIAHVSFVFWPNDEAREEMHMC